MLYAVGMIVRMFQPCFQISPATARALMAIEASRQVLDALPFTVDTLATHLGMNQRSINSLSKNRLTAGFLALDNPSREARTYRLHPDYEALLASSLS